MKIIAGRNKNDLDALDQILRLQRLRPSLYFRHAFSPPWGLTIPDATHSQFHIVVRGHCFLRVASSGSLRMLSAGDIALLPTGAAHSVLSHPESKAVPGGEVLAAIQCGQPAFDGESASAELVCGHFDSDRNAAWIPLLKALPEVIHVPAESYGQATEATIVAGLLTKEMGSGLGGEGLVAEKLAEALFVLTLRAYARLENPESGLLAAMRDPRIGRALALIHRTDGERMSLDDLAGAIGMSRSAFAQRFKELTDLSPIAYTDRWRLLRAQHMLRETGLPIAEIANRTGYESEPAFHRAFKREFRDTPGRVRAASKNS